jgi:diaminopimelate decarboxylase
MGGLGDDANQYLDMRSTPATIAGQPVDWWEAAFGLPLHVSFAPLVRRNVRAFRRTFDAVHSNGEIRFAAKAFPHPALLEIVREEGGGVDVASYNETLAALAAGHAPHALDLNGNCKEDALLDLAIERDILLVVDSLEEIRRRARVSASRRRQVHPHAARAQGRLAAGRRGRRPEPRSRKPANRGALGALQGGTLDDMTNMT